MVDRREMLDLLASEGASEALLKHVQYVADRALWIADAAIQEGKSVDRDLVEAAALLHDAGIPKRVGTPVVIPEYGAKATGLTSDDFLHGIYGYKTLIRRGIDRRIARGALTHLNGPDNATCRVLGVEPPKEEAVAATIEERIVAYADLLVWIAALERNPWREGEAAILFGIQPYACFFWKQATGESMDADHPWLQRFLAVDRDLRRYARPADYGMV